MKLTTPIIYDVSYRRFRENISFEIESLSKDEAPVAVRTRGEEFRWHDGVFYRQMGKPRAFFREHIAGKSDEEMLEYAFSRFLEQRTHNSGDDVAEYMHTRTKTSDKIYSEKRYPEFKESRARLKAHRKVAAFSEHAKAIGDEFWIRCGEPCLQITTAMEIEIACVQATGEPERFGLYDIPPSLSTSRLRRLDALDAVQEILEERGQERCEPPKFELLLPDTLQRQDAKEALYGVAAFMTALDGGSWGEARDRIEMSGDAHLLERLAGVVGKTPIMPLNGIEPQKFDEIYECLAGLSWHFADGSIFRLSIDMALAEYDRQPVNVFGMRNIPAFQ